MLHSFVGSAIKAANFFSVGKRKSVGINHLRTGNILAGGSDSDSEGAIGASDEDGAAKESSRPKPDFQKTIVEDSDNDLITEDEDDDIPLVQLGTEYLSDSKFEKINSWIQDSPFSKRLSDYSSRVKKSPTNADNSVEEVESLLKSDPEDGDPVPSWAAPLPSLSTSRSTFVGERSSKAMLTSLSKDDREEDTTNKSSTLRSELTSQPSRGQDLSSKDYIPSYGHEEASSVTSSSSGSNKKSEKDKSKDNSNPSDEHDDPHPDASQGSGKAHENDRGPVCFKCDQVCKDNYNLRNHILSHYYQVFYKVLPDSKPYPCPKCDRHSRDRITLVRHFAFAHKKLFEMTDVTQEHLGGARIKSKSVAPSRAKPQKKEDKALMTSLSGDEGEDSMTNISSSLRSEHSSQPSRGQDLCNKDYIPSYGQDEGLSAKSSSSGSTEKSEKDQSNANSNSPHNLDDHQPLDDSLDKTIDKLELLNVKADKFVNKSRTGRNFKTPKEDPIVISSDEDEVVKEVTFVSKKKSPLKAKPKTNLIENSVNNAVRCWTEVQTKQLEEAKTKSKQRRVSSSSSNSEELENFFSKVKSTRKKVVISSSDSDKDFIVPDNEFDSDEFDEIDDAPVLNLKDRILRKTTASTNKSSPPRIDGATPVSRNPKSSKPGVKTDWRERDGSCDSSDSKSSSGFPTNIYQPKFYNQIPKPTLAITQPSLVTTPKTSTSKKPARSRKPEPKSSSIQKPESFRTPTNPASTLTFLSSLTMDTPIERCHPQALPYINNFKKSKEELAKQLYQMYNVECFDHALPDDMEISWNVRLTKTAGLCYSQRHRKFNVETRSSRIELSTKVIDRGDRLRDTLIHEMCHAASWIISGYRDGHGPLWRTWAEKAMRRFPELPVIDRCHSYQIQTKYTYKCVQCGYSIGRHSKSLDTERKVCGHCHGRFELVVNTGGGATPSSGAEARTPRAPTGFAKFVQDNYKVYKQPGTNHAEVMKILSNKFSATKITK